MYITQVPLYIQSNPKLMDIVELVTEGFKGINCKDGVPYLYHCLSVANFAENLLNQSFISQNFGISIDPKILWIVALCHDVVEDLPEEYHVQLKAKLFEAFGTDFYFDCIQQYLTYDKQTTTRKEYIENIANGPTLVKLCKSADLIHNTLISRTKGNSFKSNIARITKYMDEFNRVNNIDTV